jgi:hypothetical protein
MPGSARKLDKLTARWATHEPNAEGFCAAPLLAERGGNNMPPTGTTILDNFNRTDGLLGANWSSTDPVGSTGTDWTIATNQILAGTSAYLAEAWTAATYGPNCYAGVTIAALPSGAFSNVSVWIGLHGGIGTSAADGHRLTINATEVLIETITNGAESTIGASISETRQAGDAYLLERAGTTLEAWRLRGGSWTSLGTRTAVYTATGNVALSMYDPGGTGRLDDFMGGTNASGTDGTATSPAAIGLADFPAPTLSAGATITAVPAAALGDFPASAMQIGVDLAAPAALTFGDFPVPTVTGTGDGTVTAVPATGLGDLPIPAIQWGSGATVPAATGLGDFPAPAVTGTVSGTVTAVPADATGDFPPPTVTPLVARTRHGETDTGGTPVTIPSTGGTLVTASHTGGNEPAYHAGGNEPAYATGGLEVELVGA